MCSLLIVEERAELGRRDCSCQLLHTSELIIFTADCVINCLLSSKTSSLCTSVLAICCSLLNTLEELNTAVMAMMCVKPLWIALMSVVSLTYAAPHILLSQAVKGDLLLRNIFITNPFQADPTSSYNSTLSSMLGLRPLPAELIEF